MSSILLHNQPAQKSAIEVLAEICTNRVDISSQVDTDVLMNHAQRHRLVAQTHDFISKSYADEAAKEKSGRIAQRILKKNLGLAHHLVFLQRKFDQANIEFLTLKGPALAHYLFGNVGLRQSNDLDILIEEKDLLRSDELLRSLGFEDISEPQFHTFDEQQKNAFIQISHELPYYHSEKGVKVELHWKTVAPRSLFPRSEQTVWQATQTIILGGQQIKILGDEDLLLYLCVHGAKHQWFRLFWLRDVYLLISKKTFDLDALLDHLASHGNHRALLSGLFLCNRFFGYKLTDYMIALGQSDDVFQQVLERSVSAILLPEEESAPANGENIWHITKNLMQLKRGWRFKLECLHRFRTSPQDWILLPLPSYLFFLYYPLRPLLMFLRGFKRKSA